MSVLIKDMEMPTRCGRCDMCVPEADGDIDWHNVCCITGADIVDVGEKMVDCPLVHVPSHGRCIDADALRARVNKMQEELWDKLADADVGNFAADDVKYRIYEEIEDFLNEAPTIIPSDGREKT